MLSWALAALWVYPNTLNVGPVYLGSDRVRPTAALLLNQTYLLDVFKKKTIG